jgi:plasmid stabilization system protein ParE
MYDINWTRGAESDVAEIWDDLEHYHAGSGDEFLTNLNFSAGLLKSHPGLGPVFRSPLRRLLTHRRTVGIYYIPEVSRISVHFVLRVRDNPLFLERRLHQLSRRLLEGTDD